jgi:large subunit ribosomal protein L21
MHAIFETGGKQYRVAPGDAVRVEKVEGPLGQVVEFNKVLLVQGEEELHLGKPYVRGARVLARIESQGRGSKIRVFKMKRRKGQRRKIGHRQSYTGLRVQEIRI